MHKEKVIFFFIVFLSRLLSATPTSLIDQKFKLGRYQNSLNHEKTEIEKVYTDVFSKTMYSKCRWLPSDTQYLKIKTNSCGQARGSILAIGRFIMESDAFMISNETVNDNGHLGFVYSKAGCDVF